MMSIFQTVFLSLVVLLIFHTAPSLQAGAGLNAECAVDSDCDPDKFLICNKASTSCKKGVCNCKDRYTSGSGVCTLNAWLGQTCDANTIILTQNGECASGKVACKSGYTRIANFLCGNINDKVLNEACDTSTDPADICWLYAEYYAGSGACSDNWCGCRSTGQIWDGYDCRSRRIGDQCGRSSDCPGDSHCVSAACSCVTEETQYRGDCYKSTHYGSKKEGEVCDFTTNKCILDLTCAVCQENQGNVSSPSIYTCVQRGPYSGSPVRFADAFIVLSASIVTLSRFLF